MENIKSGIICLIGAPNVGKSSLLNLIIGQKLQAVSPKPETTQKALLGVKTTDKYQIGFVDTPGITFKPKTKLEQLVTKEAYASLLGNDIIYLLVDRVYNEEIGQILNLLKKENEKVFLIITKQDILKKHEILEIILSFKDKYDFEEIIPISSKTNFNIDLLLELTLKNLNNQGYIYPKDYITSQSFKDSIQEVLREQMFRNYDKEIPYSSLIEVERYNYIEEKNLFEVQYTITCLKQSQKSIIIGNKGNMINNLKKNVSIYLRKLLNCKIDLEIFVKVDPKWQEKQARAWMQ